MTLACFPDAVYLPCVVVANRLGIVFAESACQGPNDGVATSVHHIALLEPVDCASLTRSLRASPQPVTVTQGLLTN